MIDSNQSCSGCVYRSPYQELRAVLAELVTALDQSADASEHADDVAAMLRYGAAEKAARAILATPAAQQAQSWSGNPDTAAEEAAEAHAPPAAPPTKGAEPRCVWIDGRHGEQCIYPSGHTCPHGIASEAPRAAGSDATPSPDVGALIAALRKEAGHADVEQYDDTGAGGNWLRQVADALTRETARADAAEQHAKQLVYISDGGEQARLRVTELEEVLASYRGTYTREKEAREQAEARADAAEKERNQALDQCVELHRTNAALMAGK